jgi:hypothetical protein
MTPLMIRCTGETKGDKTYRNYSFGAMQENYFIELEQYLADYGLSDEQIVQCLTPLDLDREYLPEFLDPTNKKFLDDSGNLKTKAYVDAVLAKQAETIGKPNVYTGTQQQAKARPFREFNRPNRRVTPTESEEQGEAES